MVVWCCDVDTAEDANLSEGDMHLARTPILTPPSAQVSRGLRSLPGTLVLPDRGQVDQRQGERGAAKGAGSWEGTSNSLIVILKKWPKFSLFLRHLGPISLAYSPLD